MTLMARRCLAEDIEGLNRFAQAQGFDIEGFLNKLLSGEGLAPDAMLAYVRQAVFEALSSLAADLAFPVVGCVLVRSICGRGGMDRVMNLMGALCCTSALTRVWADGERQLTVLLDGIANATEALTPALVSASALSGGTFWSSMTASLSGVCAAFLNRALRDWGIRLCGIGATVALCCAVSGRYALNRLFDLTKSAARWLLAGVMLIYGGLVSAQGLAGVSMDGAAMKAAKSAIESVVPIIGGGVSDGLGNILGSIGTARGLLGIIGVALLLSVCVTPLVKIGTGAAALRLIAALTEPLAEGKVSELISRFGEIMALMFAIGVCAVVMASMLPACFAVMAANL